MAGKTRPSRARGFPAHAFGMKPVGKKRPTTPPPTEDGQSARATG